MRVSLRATARQYPIAAFVVGAFVWSWIWWVPLALSLRGMPATNIPLTLAIVLLGAFGPTVSAIVVTGAQAGRAGIRRLLWPLFRWRIAWWWYLALAIPPLLWCLTVVFASAVLPITLSLAAPWYLFPLVVLSSIIGGPIAEEVGWRGYLVPWLQQRSNALLSGVVVGIVWALWHLPVFYVQGIALAIAETGQPLAMLRYMLTAIPVGVLFVWLYNNSHGSLWLAILFHASLNASGGFVLSAQTPTPAPAQIQQLTWLYVVVVAVVTLLVICYWGPTDLARTARIRAIPAEPEQTSVRLRPVEVADRFPTREQC